jgi:circadian clock protein KaiC
MENAQPAHGGPRPPLERVATGVRGLDTVLRGGIPHGSLVLVVGTPGTGKTTLGNQLAYLQAAKGQRAVFTTTMVESHDRMLAHLGGFGFFDPAQVGDGVAYLNVLDALREGTEALGSALRHIVQDEGASLLVMDGTAVIRELAASSLDFRELANQLQAQSVFLGCTTVLLVNRDADVIGDIAAHVDGLITLRQEREGARHVRTLEVVKLRGAHHLGGRHEFAIGPDGIAVFPRLEAGVTLEEREETPPDERVGFGLPALDAMVGGGLLPGSSTLLMGTPGAGKTLTGLHLLVAGAQRGERGLLAGFHERPGRLVRAAASIGLDLASHVESGRIRILWRPPLELSPDAWAWQLLAAVREHRPTRLVVDALTDVERRIADPSRAPDVVAALTGELRSAGVTSLFTAELDTLVGPELRVPLPAISVAMDTLLLLRNSELRSRLQRLVSVLKMRESAFDPAIRSFTIGDQGLAIGEPFTGVAALLTGIPSPVRTEDV